ncbi:MAG: crossover junction endodeoxyribonuclease RuvC [Candidatus Peribacteria bacterium]|nr:crossover junction endodeoxyribonuclease RuvC [Candidatus Peribacteria bacterium]
MDAGILLQDKKVPTRTDQFERVSQIYHFFETLITTHPISRIGIEKLFFTHFNQNNAEFVYAIRGALMMLFLRHHLPVQEYSPIELKKYITGNGKADKMLVQKTIMRFFNLANLPSFNDSADALGLAYLASRRK